MLDAEEGAEEGVAARLGDDTRAGINEDDGEVGRGAARNHIARILLVARGVGDDELTLVGGEIAVGHVDGDALLSLGLEAVEQEGVVNMASTSIAHALGIALEGGELVFVEFLGIKEEASDEGGLAVVNRTCGEESQEVFLLVLVEVFLDGHLLIIKGLFAVGVGGYLHFQWGLFEWGREGERLGLLA